MLAVAPAGASRRRLSLLPPLFVLLLAAISWATGLTLAADDGPLDLPPLEAPAGQWLEAARETAPGDEPDESGVHALLLEIEYRLDEDRRADYRYHLVYQIVSPGAVRPWSTVSRSWRPWFEERPEVRARVISPDGEEKYLDASNLGEYSESESGPDVYGDTLTLRGPLPTLGVGSIVEEVHVVRDRTPYFDAGTAKRLVLQMHVPLHRARVVLDYPASLPLRWTTYELPGIEVDRKERDGRVRITFEDGPFEARGYPEPLAPSDVPDGPALEFSTAESWTAVATAYARVVDEQLGSPALTKLTRRATRGVDGREQIVGRLVDLLHERVRYTAVAFGEQALVPVSPQTTIDRGFGDCKDKSTLLVGLLGEAGISAHVALLSTGPGPDVNPELPGLGAFDHAIVYVPGDEPLWIDPTDPYARPGELPEVDQGRLALIAAPDTEALLRTPASLPEDNLLSETREVFLPDLGNARIVETGRVTGEFDRMYRYSFADATNDELRGYFRRRSWASWSWVM
jgi:transglutaminase-like putative cysteine protease